MKKIILVLSLLVINTAIGSDPKSRKASLSKAQKAQIKAAEMLLIDAEIEKTAAERRVAVCAPGTVDYAREEVRRQELLAKSTAMRKHIKDSTPVFVKMGNRAAYVPGRLVSAAKACSSPASLDAATCGLCESENTLLGVEYKYGLGAHMICRPCGIAGYSCERHKKDNEIKHAMCNLKK